MNQNNILKAAVLCFATFQACLAPLQPWEQKLVEDSAKALNPGKFKYGQGAAADRWFDWSFRDALGGMSSDGLPRDLLEALLEKLPDGFDDGAKKMFKAQNEDLLRQGQANFEKFVHSRRRTFAAEALFDDYFMENLCLMAWRIISLIQSNFRGQKPVLAGAGNTPQLALDAVASLAPGVFDIVRFAMSGTPWHNGLGLKKRPAALKDRVTEDGLDKLKSHIAEAFNGIDCTGRPVIFVDLVGSGSGLAAGINVAKDMFGLPPQQLQLLCLNDGPIMPHDAPLDASLFLGLPDGTQVPSIGVIPVSLNPNGSRCAHIPERYKPVQDVTDALDAIPHNATPESSFRWFPVYPGGAWEIVQPSSTEPYGQKAKELRAKIMDTMPKLAINPETTGKYQAMFGEPAPGHAAAERSPRTGP